VAGAQPGHTVVVPTLVHLESLNRAITIEHDYILPFHLSTCHVLLLKTIVLLYFIIPGLVHVQISWLQLLKR
jgi:hypothetical protein